MMAQRLPILIAIATFALARAAFAADPAVTAAPMTTAPSDATAAQIDAWLTDDGAAVGDETRAPPPSDLQAPAPRAIHGEASVGFGSNGYREAQVAAAIPVGQTSTLGVAVGDERFRGYDRRNLDLSLAIGTGASGEPCGLYHSGVQLASDAARRARCGQGPDLAAP